MKKVEAVIFDIDGTLLDSNDAHTRAFEEAFKEQGRNFTYSEIRRMIGMGSDHLIPALTRWSVDSSEGKQVSKRKKEIFFSKYLPYVKPFAGAKELVQHFNNQSIEVAIASSASASELKMLLEIIGINHLLDSQSCSDDAEASKPDPDIILAALSKIKSPASHAIMIGDTPYDIEAAERAGIDCIAFRCGGFWMDQDLKKAAAIYDSPLDFLSSLG